MLIDPSIQRSPPVVRLRQWLVGVWHGKEEREQRGRTGNAGNGLNGVIESKLGYELFRGEWIHEPSCCHVNVVIFIIECMLS